MTECTYESTAITEPKKYMMEFCKLTGTCSQRGWGPGWDSGGWTVKLGRLSGEGEGEGVRA